MKSLMIGQDSHEDKVILLRIKNFLKLFTQHANVKMYTKISNEQQDIYLHVVASALFDVLYFCDYLLSRNKSNSHENTQFSIGDRRMTEYTMHESSFLEWKWQNRIQNKGTSIKRPSIQVIVSILKAKTNNTMEFLLCRLNVI